MMKRFAWTDFSSERIMDQWAALGGVSRVHLGESWQGLVLDPLPRDVVTSKGYSSQLGQDVLLDVCIFNQQRHGVFIDVGAHDGLSLSNSYPLEAMRSWSGILLEPNPDVYVSLRRNRKEICLNIAVGDHVGEADFTVLSGYTQMLSGLTTKYPDQHKSRIEREIKERGGESRQIRVQIRTLQSVLDATGIEAADILMIDTEGSELAVLQGIDFGRTSLNAILVEENYNNDEVADFLQLKGYERKIRIGWDSLFFQTNQRSPSLARSPLSK